MKRLHYIIVFISSALLMVACSTTRNLPPEEVLYTGIKDTEILNTLEPNWEGEFLFDRLAGGNDFIGCRAPLAYFGDPRIATAETGVKVYERYADHVVEEVLNSRERTAARQ